MSHGTGLAEALLGLPGFRVLEVSATPDELVARDDRRVHRMRGVRHARPAHERVEVAIRDRPCFGRPAYHSVARSYR